MNQVFFVGAGPGDPDLITVKGRALLQTAELIIYAGSLVNPALLLNAKDECKILDSAGMTLEQVVTEMIEAYRKGHQVVRLHTGDPSIYGAIREQMDLLDKEGIPYSVVPGVSSFLAAAAALKKEYTLPGVSQTVILTRMEGRTAVPELESIEKLAMHQATMVIFLSVHMIDELCEKLKAGYNSSTPAAIVYKASWPEQIVIEGTLETLPAMTRDRGITSTALVVVGHFQGNVYELSKLYDREFGHSFRSAQ